MTRAVLLLLLAVAPARAATFVLSHTIPNPAPASADLFGSAVAVGSPGLLVGARFDDPGGFTNTGSAYLFDLGSGGLLRTIPNPVPAAGDSFGFAVATLGDDLLVSAPEHNGGAARSGVVYRIDAATGAVLRTYAKTPPAAGAKLGFAIAALGGDVVAGAPYEGSGGGAYLFDGQTGALLWTFINPSHATADLFGRAVAAAGTTAVVAAPFNDMGAVNAGVVYLFDTQTGLLVRVLSSPRPNVGDSFGLAVAAEGNLVLVGSPYDHSTPSNAGAAYLFDATTGALLRSFISPAVDARFGSAVAMSGGTVLIGAPFADGDTTDVGRAYLFDIATGALLATLENPTPAAGDQFGAAVALAGTTVAVGAWLDDTGAENAGAAYHFIDVSTPTTSSTTSTSTSTTSTSTTSTTSTSTSSTSTTSTSTTSESTTSTTSTSATTATTETSTTTTSASSATSSTSTSTTVTTVSSAPTSSEEVSTTTATATSTSVPPPPPTTTTTTTVPTCAGGCDDGDPCTADTCTTGGTCLHDPATGFDAVTCRLDALDAVLHATEPLAIGGPRLGARLQRKIARTRGLVEAARQARSAFSPLRRAERVLAAFIRLVRRGEGSGRMARATAERLLVLSADAASQLAPLRGGAFSALTRSRHPY